jgi:hypothetical protein
MRHGTIGLWGAVAIIGGLGCSSPDKLEGDGDGGDQTTVSGDKTLSDLTSAEIAQVCKEASPSLVAVSCNLAGFISASYSAAYDLTLTDAQLSAACADAATACRTQLATPDCSAVSQARANCSATVDEYFACVGDTFARSPDCSQTTRKLLSGSGPDLTSPPSCETLAMKCPGIDY